MIALRPYQLRAIDAVRVAFLDGHRCVLLVGPTGFGKTAVASHLIAEITKRGKRVLFAVHRREIVLDTAARLSAAGVLARVVMPGAKDAPLALVSVASVPTLAAREVHVDADFVIFDEAHHVVANTWRAIAEQYPDARILGLTATPERADGSPLGDMFERLVVGATIGELTRAGHLVPCDVIAPAPSVENALAMDPVDAWAKHAHGRSTIVFCANVNHAGEVTRAFTARRIEARMIVGDTRTSDRDEAIGAFKRGDVKILVNVYALTEGFDAPIAKCVMLARGCGHVGTYLQMVGRVLRPDPASPTTKARLIDLRGVVHLHGLPSEERTYSLAHGITRAAPEALDPCTSCRHCGAYFETREARNRRCPLCGAPLPAPKPPRVKERAIDRVQVVATTLEKRAYLDRVQGEALARGFKSGWAAHRFKARFGHWPDITTLRGHALEVAS